MDLNIGRDYKHYGDNIEDGGRKYVYNGIDKHTEPLTIQELKRKIEAILPEITSMPMWFPVCRYMMWHHICAERNFKRACEIIMSLFPELKLDEGRIRKIYVGTLKGELDDWEFEENLPFKDEDTFEQYKFIAVRMYEL